MPRYSPFVDALLQSPDLLSEITPAQPRDAARVTEIREANENKLSGGGIIRDIRLITLIRAALFYAYDALPEAHRITQAGNEAIAYYLHGMVHRREADFENARYWFAQAKTLPFFASIPAALGTVGSWDPVAFTKLCEQARSGSGTRTGDLARTQRTEFDAVFDYLWRLTVERPLAPR